MFDYKTTIADLRYKSDLNAGVIPTLSDKNGTTTIIRDARNIKKTAPCRPENYLVQAFNILRAGKALLEIHQKSKQSSQPQEGITEETDLIDTIATNIANELKTHQDTDPLTESLCLQILKNTTVHVVNILQNNGVTDYFKLPATQLLDVTKNYTGLEDDHPAVMTILATKDSNNNNYAINSQPLYALTNKQKEQFNSLNQQKWFNDLPEYQQLLVKKYKTQLTDGRHLVPTQIRNIPGLRNSYKTEVVVLDREKSDTTKTITKFIQSGTMVSFAKDKESAEKITQENFAQLHQNVGDKIHTITLNSNNTLDTIDNIAVQETEKATQKYNQNNALNQKNFVHSNAPLNFLRFASPTNYTGMNDLLKQISTQLNRDEFGKVADYLQDLNGVSFKSANAELNDPTQSNNDKSMKEVLLAAIELKQLTTEKPKNLLQRILNFNYRLYTKGENKPLKVVRKYIALNTLLLKQDKPLITRASLPIPHITCKSGKDRTGFAQFIIISDAINRDIMKSNMEDKNLFDRVNNDISMAGHTQYLPGVCGGTPGCIGIKNLYLLIPQEFTKNIATRLQQPTAEFSTSTNKLNQSFQIRNIFSSLNNFLKSKTKPVQQKQSHENKTKSDNTKKEKSSSEKTLKLSKSDQKTQTTKTKAANTKPDKNKKKDPNTRAQKAYNLINKMTSKSKSYNLTSQANSDKKQKNTHVKLLNVSRATAQDKTKTQR